MIQQNGNKQHFTINSATSCGFDRICEHTQATKFTQRLIEWCVSLSFRRRTLYPQQSPTIVVPGRIYALTMASNVSSERSATIATQVSPIPA